MTLFRNKYRIESARYPNWDYRNNGAYFITICTNMGISFLYSYYDLCYVDEK